MCFGLIAIRCGTFWPGKYIARAALSCVSHTHTFTRKSPSLTQVSAVRHLDASRIARRVSHGARARPANASGRRVDDEFDSFSGQLVSSPTGQCRKCAAVGHSLHCQLFGKLDTLLLLAHACGLQLTREHRSCWRPRKTISGWVNKQKWKKKWATAAGKS